MEEKSLANKSRNYRLRGRRTRQEEIQPWGTDADGARSGSLPKSIPHSLLVLVICKALPVRALQVPGLARHLLHQNAAHAHLAVLVAGEAVVKVSRGRHGVRLEEFDGGILAAHEVVNE